MGAEIALKAILQQLELTSDFVVSPTLQLK